MAGVVAAGFHWWLTEPVIEHAIQLEARTRESGTSATTAPAVERPTQRRGLVAGFLGLGVVWGLLVGLLTPRLLAWLPERWPAAVRALAVALLVGWSVSVLPSLRYPANPPGAGEAGSIGQRQQRYFGMGALSLAGMVGAVGLYSALSKRLVPAPLRARAAPPLVAVGLYMLYAAALFRLMPVGPESTALPAELMQTFRRLSLGGLVLFWAILGGAFGWLTRGAQLPAG